MNQLRGLSGNETGTAGVDGGEVQHTQSFLNEYYTLLCVTAILPSVLLLLVSFWLREVCYDRFGLEVCVGSVSMARRREMRRQQVVTRGLQRQMERGLQESSLTVREERKAIYRKFLQPFTKVVAPEDIRVEDEKDTEDPQRVLHICDESSCTDQCTEASCIICFKDYEEGEEVVWSSRDGCSHAYHLECMLKWLSTGKKRCPICRQWFVPGFCFNEMKKRVDSGYYERPGNLENDTRLATTTADPAKTVPEPSASA